MATCKECFHFDACVDRLGTTKFYDNDIAVNNVEDMCKTFKDKNLVREQPCNVGDTVYVIFDMFKKKIDTCRVDEFLIGEDGMSAVLDVHHLNYHARRRATIPVSWFGRFAFTARGLVEQALKDGVQE